MIVLDTPMFHPMYPHPLLRMMMLSCYTHDVSMISDSAAVADMEQSYSLWPGIRTEKQNREIALQISRSIGKSFRSWAELELTVVCVFFAATAHHVEHERPGRRAKADQRHFSLQLLHDGWGQKQERWMMTTRSGELWSIACRHRIPIWKKDIRKSTNQR